MTYVFLTPVMMSGLEVRDVRAEALGSLPPPDATQASRYVYHAAQLKYCDGTQWITLGAAGAGGPPSGAASGDLTGNYPSPQIAAGVILDADVNASAAIQQSKIANLTTDLAAKALGTATVGAGAGMTGGGTVASNPTLNVIGGTGITVAADSVAVDAAAVQMKSEKAAASGYAPLDSTTKVPVNNLPWLNEMPNPIGPLSMNAQRITNLFEPSLTGDAATKGYVDLAVQGLAWKDAVRAGTTANIALSAPQTIDGVAVLADERVLVKDQTAPAQNGIYLVKAGAWQRAPDASYEANILGAAVFVTEGTTLADTAWVMTTNAPIAVGSTAINWVQFGASTAYIAGAGLLLTGTTFDVITGSGISVAGDQVSVNFAGTGSAVTASKSDHTHADVPTTRQVLGGQGLTGGGALTGDVTLDVVGDATMNISANSIGVQSAPQWTTPRSLTLTGDVTGTIPAMSGIANVSMATTLAVAAVKHFAGNVAAGTAVVINHALNTRDVTVEVYRNSTPWDSVGCDVERTDVNNVTLRFSTSVAANAYRCVVVGR